METIAAIVLALVIVLVILDLLRRKKIREKYAALWLIVGAATLILGIFPELLAVAADLTGVSVPSNLLFALGILFVLGVLLHLSFEISALEDETRTLAEEVAILRAQVESLLEPADRARRAVPSSRPSTEPTMSATDRTTRPSSDGRPGAEPSTAAPKRASSPAARPTQLP